MANVKNNCGGAAVSPFTADAFYSNGTTFDYTAVSGSFAVDTSLVSNPPPQSAYRTVRLAAAGAGSTVSYTVTGLTASAVHTVRLHFQEGFSGQTVGARVFNIAINGVTVLTNFDIMAAAGTYWKGVVREFSATANGSGQITIVLTNVTSQAIISAFEVSEIVYVPLNDDQVLDHLVYRTGLAAWYEPFRLAGLASGQAVPSMQDLSGSGRHLIADSSTSNQPIYELNAKNGKPALYFNGSTTAPMASSGAVTLKQIFIVARYQDAAFPSGSDGAKGLLSGLASGNLSILAGNPADTKFFNNAYGANFSYYKNYRSFAESSQSAPVGNVFAIISAKKTDGWALDGIQIGQDRVNTNRRWKGSIMSLLGYTEILPDYWERKLFERFAMLYQIWRENSAGTHIFPFNPDWGSGAVASKTVFVSEAEDGARTGTVKRNLHTDFQLSFQGRLAAEYKAARQFYDEHYPLAGFVFRDESVSPSEDTEGWYSLDSTAEGRRNGYDSIDYGFGFNQK